MQYQASVPSHTDVATITLRGGIEARVSRMPECREWLNVLHGQLLTLRLQHGGVMNGQAAGPYVHQTRSWAGLEELVVAICADTACPHDAAASATSYRAPLQAVANTMQVVGACMMVYLVWHAQAALWSAPRKVTMGSGQCWWGMGVQRE
jgi:hypothetical protein